MFLCGIICDSVVVGVFLLTLLLIFLLLDDLSPGAKQPTACSLLE
jgi:hypothetical protein